MYKFNCLNPISNVGLDLMPGQYQKVEEMSEANAVLVRSAAMHDLELPKSLEAIARAGAGVNNIPLDKCAEAGIVVFNTPGANANGVKELVIAGLLLSARDLVGGINWVNSVKDDPAVADLVEKQKAKYAGIEIQGKKLGVIGLGAIGVLVANVAYDLGMEVRGYDPYISVSAAWSLNRDIKPSQSLDDIYRESDYITIHVPLLDETKGMIGKEALSIMKDGVGILNFARDTLVNEADLKEALASGKVSKYVTDFPTPGLVGLENVISIPHLGASTNESEDNCAVMAVRQVMDYLENGNIKNSVNYPNCDMGVCNHAGRIAINNKNVPNMITQFTAVFAKENINIPDMINKSMGKWAYTILDIDSPATPEIVRKLEAIDGVLKVRIIK